MRLFTRILAGSGVGFVLLITGMHLVAKSGRETENAYLSTLKKSLTLSSKSFPPNGDMPVSCTCKGKEASPALTWENASPLAESYVVLTTDYDVPTPAFPLYNLSHWVLYNLPASVRSLPEGVTVEQLRLLGGRMGRNGTGKTAYIGPCPPLGRHAYVLRVYALDQMLSFADLPGKQAVLEAMKGHILGYGELTGYFQ